MRRNSFSALATLEMTFEKYDMKHSYSLSRFYVYKVVTLTHSVFHFFWSDKPAYTNSEKSIKVYL